MIQMHIKEKILEKAISLEQKLGIRDLAWNKEDVKALIKSLMNDDIVTLGGDVYKVINKEIIPLGDNWDCEPEDKETKQDYLIRSKTKSLDYIDKYPIINDEKYLFSLVFNEDF